MTREEFLFATTTQYEYLDKNDIYVRFKIHPECGEIEIIDFYPEKMIKEDQLFYANKELKRKKINLKDIEEFYWRS